MPPKTPPQPPKPPVSSAAGSVHIIDDAKSGASKTLVFVLAILLGLFIISNIYFLSSLSSASHSNNLIGATNDALEMELEACKSDLQSKEGEISVLELDISDCEAEFTQLQAECQVVQNP